MTRTPSTAEIDAIATRPGVFSSEMLRAAVEAGLIRVPRAQPIADAQFQPASLDLRLGDRAHRLRSSFLPGIDSTISERLADLEMGSPLDLGADSGAVLERGRPYLIPLIETVELPPNVRGRTNPRSSTGRLDIFTRVITDHGIRFDEVPKGYRGQLWLEVYSNTFTISVRTGIALAQLRLSTSGELIKTEELVELHREAGLLFEAVKGGREQAEKPMIETDGLFISVSLQAGEGDLAGWQAKPNSGLLDLSAVGKYDARDFWEPVYAEPPGRLVLHPEAFYLLISREFVRIPPGVAAEMVAYDPTNGELRTHYAGFFDPGFGYGKGGTLQGTRAVLEVRAHDVPFMLEDGQPVARFAYERMAAEPARLYGDDAAASHFQQQGIALSRQFKQPGFVTRMATASEPSPRRPRR